MNYTWLYLAIACDVVAAVALRSHDLVGSVVFGFGMGYAGARVFPRVAQKAKAP